MKKPTEIKAPNYIPSKNEIENHIGYKGNLYVFLAGSIEMGAAELWQDRAVKMLEGTRWVAINPRRDDWDSSWEQKASNPKFREQVEWELRGLNRAQAIILYFDPATKAPISLLELGLFARRKIVVVCPEGFWRKGNVDIVCEHWNIQQKNTLEEAVEWVKQLP